MGRARGIKRGNVNNSCFVLYVYKERDGGEKRSQGWRQENKERRKAENGKTSLRRQKRERRARGI